MSAPGRIAPACAACAYLPVSARPSREQARPRQPGRRELVAWQPRLLDTTLDLHGRGRGRRQAAGGGRRAAAR